MPIVKSAKNEFSNQIENSLNNKYAMNQRDHAVQKKSQDNKAYTVEKKSRPGYQSMIDSDQKMIHGFLEKMNRKNGLKVGDILHAIRNLSTEDMNKSPQSTVEALFKHIDLPFSKKIQAIRLYEKFVKERGTALRSQLGKHNKARILNGESRDIVMKDDSAHLRPNHKSTVDLGLAIYQAQNSGSKYNG